MRIIGSGLEGYLHRKARERALNLAAEAKAQAQKILEEASQQAEALEQQILQEAQEKAAKKRRQILAQAELQAKQVLLQYRETLLQRVWRECEERLRHIDDPDQRLQILKALIRDAAEQLGAQQLQVQVNEKDQALLKEGALAQIAAELGLDLTLAPEPAPIMGGVIVRHAKELVDNSLDTRLGTARQSLRDEVYRRLMQEA